MLFILHLRIKENLMMNQVPVYLGDRRHGDRRHGDRCVSDSLRKTPLGTPLVAAAAGRCYSPLSNFQTPPPIREEEPIAAAATEPCDSRKVLTSDL